ncbi:MAG: CHASE3 domain-containing protein [Bacteroidetes bacterium]|nr:CHASE3 domain-containing protein [Bacteroidota bacterium]
MNQTINSFIKEDSARGLSFEKKLYLIFSCIIVVLFVTFWLLFSNYTKAKKNSFIVEHTWQVLYQSERLNQQYRNMMVQSRGFVITGIDEYEKGFKKDTLNIRQSFKELVMLTSDNVLQQEHLKKLNGILNLRINFASHTMRLRQQEGLDSASKLIALGEGVMLSSRIDSIITRIQSLEQTLLNERSESNEVSNRQVFFVIWLLLGVLFFILIMVVYLIITTLRIRAKTAEDLKQSELNVQTLKAEQKYRHALDNMLEGIQIIGKDWRYVYVNEAVTKQGKYTADQMLGRTIMELYPGVEKSELFKVLQACLIEKSSKVLESEFTFPDGSTSCFELSVQAVPEGIFILSIDISERKKAEAELKTANEDLEKKVVERTEELSQVNAELESFSYSVSHDLRAPLRAISGYASILSEDHAQELGKEGLRLLGVINSNITSMGNLINDLLIFAKMGKDHLNKTGFSMNEIVNEVVGAQVDLNPEKVIITNVKPLPTVVADKNMMKQVLINLISNAIKYSSKNEKIEIEIGSSESARDISFYIKDNGVGFDMKYYDKLFGVFQRLHSPRDFEGTGIGLALAHRIINRHKGHIWAESTTNRGATFYFSLPK